MNQVQGNGTPTDIASVNIHCTYPGCRCLSFATSTDNVRQCRNCPHGWVPHALHRIGIVYQWDMQKYDPVAFDSVFGIASLILFGTQGIPLRLHICLQRLMACLTNEEISRITKQFEWTWEEFCRGVKLLGPDGSLMHYWTYATVTDETMILGHFLKYKPTQLVATKFLRDIAVQKREENPYLQMVAPSPESGLQTFFLQNNSKPVPPAPPQMPLSILPSTSSPLPLPVSSTPVTGAPAPVMQGLPVQRPLLQPDNNGGLTSVLFHPVQNGPVRMPLSEGQSPQATPATLSFNINPQLPGLPIPSSPVVPPKRKLQPKPAPPPTPVPSESSASSSPHSLPTAVFCAMPNGHIPKLEFLPSTPEGSQTGKKASAKRVNCDHCNKTFCDKGALKIHYSAVHLKEMHRCSVKGCNMMFSSRRSRNRHSSNPNPRLHSNLFQPRRGGILAADGSDLPNQTDGMDGCNIHIGSDSDDDSRSDEEGEMRGLKREHSEDDSSQEGKLVIAFEDSRMSGAEEQAGHSTESSSRRSSIADEYHVRYPSPPYPLDFSMKSKEAAESPGKGGRCSSEQPVSGQPAKFPENGIFPEWEDDTGSLKDESTTESTPASSPVRFTERPRILVPSDPSDPCKCTECGKLFKNHFTVRTHYLNVHLKVMHVCTVPGCSAKFPSVRSRDRHSANDNLHQKSGPPPFVPETILPALDFLPTADSLPLPAPFAPVLPQYLSS